MCFSKVNFDRFSQFFERKLRKFKGSPKGFSGGFFGGHSRVYSGYCSGYYSGCYFGGALRVVLGATLRVPLRALRGQFSKLQVGGCI